MRKWILWIIITYIIASIMTGCNGGNNSFTNLIGNSSFGGGSGGGSGGTPNLVNDAKHIDTNGTDWYNSILFDPITYKYYISVLQGDTTKKLALISIKPDLTLNYSKYYEVKDTSNNTLPYVGLINLWYKDNSTFYVSGWISPDGIDYHGIIGEVNKNIGQITLKKIFENTDVLFCIKDETNIYVVSAGGYVLKLDNNYNIVTGGFKQISSSRLANIWISNNYLITYDDSNIGVVVIDKNLNNALRFNNSSSTRMNHAALVDNNNKLYYIDKKPITNNLVLAKVDITDLASPSQEMVKEYSWNNIELEHQMGFSFDGNIILGITTNEIPKNIVLLKINKDDFSIMNQVKLSSKIGGSSYLGGSLNMMSLPDGGFVISNFINSGNVGYILKGPSDLNIVNNCVFNVSDPGITTAASTTYTINITNLTLNNVTINEIPVTDYTLIEQNISTFVGCLSPAPNILNNRNGGNNQELDSLTGGSRRR
jgi:hypothetical protein